jgi:hypothetical protein
MNLKIKHHQQCHSLYETKKKGHSVSTFIININI